MITTPREDRTHFYPARFTAQAQSQIIEMDGDAFHEVTSLYAADDDSPAGLASTLPTSSYRLQVRDIGQNGGTWFNTPVISNLVFGNAANPRTLRAPIVLPPNAVLQIESSAGALTPDYNRFDVCLWGVKRYQMSAQEFAEKRQRPYFVYATTLPQTVAGTAGFRQTIQIATDADFVVQTLLGAGVFATTGTLADFSAVRVQIRDLSAGKQFFQNPMGWFQVFGEPDIWMGPNRLLSPMIFKRMSQIEVEVTIDTDDVASISTFSDVQVGFEGYKIKD